MLFNVLIKKIYSYPFKVYVCSGCRLTVVGCFWPTGAPGNCRCCVRSSCVSWRSLNTCMSCSFPDPYHRPGTKQVVCYLARAPPSLPSSFKLVACMHGQQKRIYVIPLLAISSHSPRVDDTLARQVISWFNFYCLVRTFSNSLETSLTAAALYYWVRASLNASSSFRTAWWWVGAAVAVRIQAIVPWFALYSLLLCRLARSEGGTDRVVHSVCVQVSNMSILDMYASAI